jgi:hypothetical protein
MPRLLAAALLLPVLLLNGCYTFKGISIDPRVNTYFVQVFETQATNAPITLAINFTEKLKDKIRSETRLTIKNTNPDVEFTGKVTEFRVVPVAPKPGEVVAKNQLKISLRVGFANNIDTKKGWANEREFSFFSEFDSSQDLQTVQNTLIDEISKQLLEDVFNAAFNDW